MFSNGRRTSAHGAGVFLAMQYPVELPGVRNRQFLKAALDALREERGEDELSAREFDTLYRKRVAEIGMSEDLSRRNVNEGFSGGEKKRNEILQMAVLGPRLATAGRDRLGVGHRRAEDGGGRG